MWLFEVFKELEIGIKTRFQNNKLQRNIDFGLFSHTLQKVYKIP